MRFHAIVTLMILSAILVGCNGKLDYRHRFEGEFAMRDSLATPYDSDSAAVSYVGRVYQGDEGELVLELRNGEARVVTVSRDGVFTDDSPYIVTGSYSDDDHFSLVSLIQDPLSSDTYRIYTTAERISQ